MSEFPSPSLNAVGFVMASAAAPVARMTVTPIYSNILKIIQLEK